MKDLSRNVKLYCDVCGNDQFSIINDIDCELKEAPDETKMQCSDCGKIFTKAELIELNQEVIEANIEDIKKEAVKEFEKRIIESTKEMEIVLDERGNCELF